MTQRRQNAIDLAAYDGAPPPVAQRVWQIGAREDVTGAHVGEQRLWFNTTMHARDSGHSHMFAPSDAASEREAVAWANQGLVRIRDVLAGMRIQSHSAFRARHPDLDHGLMRTPSATGCLRRGPRRCGTARSCRATRCSVYRRGCWTSTGLDSNLPTHAR